MQTPNKPTLLIVTEWHTPLGEVEIFVEGLITKLTGAFNVILAVRLHNRGELPLITAGDCVLHHFSSARQLRTIIKHYQPSLIHYQQCTQLALHMATHNRQPAAKLLVTLHYLPLEDQPAHSPFKPHPWSDLRRLSRLVSVVAPNPDVHHLAVASGVIMSGHIISTGVDTARYRPGDTIAARTELSLPFDTKLLLYTGHSDDPQFAKLVNTMAGLTLNEPAAILTLDLPSRSPLEPTIAQLATRGRLINLGTIARDDSRHPLLYQAANLYVAPSLVSDSVLPTLEAMASGLPVVTPMQLSATFAELAGNPTLEQAFGEANRKQSLRLDISQTAAAYQAIYHRLLTPTLRTR